MKRITVIFVLCLSVLLPARAAEHRTVRTLSIDSGYVPQLGTASSMRNLWSEWEGLGSGIFDLVGENTFVGKSWPVRTLWSGLYLLGWNFANYGFYVANHEMGHGTRFTATGLGAQYQWNNGWGSYSTIFGFLGEGLIRYGSGASASTTPGVIRGNPVGWLSSNAVAAGMNHSQMFAETLEERAGRDGGHIVQVVAYFRSKTDPLFYSLASQGGAFSQGDISQNLSYWNARGFGISNSEIGIGGAASLLGSFTTWAYAWSVLRYIGTGDPRVHPFRIGPVRLPDLAFFQSPYGVSYRVRTEIGDERLTVPVGVEFVYRGQFVLELSGGLSLWGEKQTRSALQAKAYLNTLFGLGIEALKEFALGPHFVFTLGAGFFTTNSLQGQRSLSFLLSDGFGADGWGRLSWVF